jgi:transposase
MSGEFRPLCHSHFVHAVWATAVRPRRMTPFLARSADDMGWNFIDANGMTGRIIRDIMSRRRPPAPEDPKIAALRAAGALHPRPEAVQDEAFARQEFFDRRDRVQVKYEMLRRHRVDGRPVTEVATAFGASRQAFYAAETAFTAAGLPGLLPRPRGPKRAHKCTDEILEFVEQQRAEAPSRSAAALADAVREHFGVAIHPRSLARALVRRKKNRASRTKQSRESRPR